MAEAVPGVKPSAQDLSAFEQAFAQDPTSEAYRPLAEAYLALGRFMEAMVVAKKGAKARPTEPAPRVVLARIYAEQGKDPRALEELATALQSHPKDVPALKLQAQVLFKSGQKGAGSEALLKAHAVAPADPELGQLMAKFGVQPPAPPPVVTRAPPPSPSSPTIPEAAGQPGRAPGGAPQPSRPSMPQPSRPSMMSAQQSRPSMLQFDPQAAYHLAKLAEEEEAIAQRAKGDPRLFATVIMLVLLVFAAGAWWAFQSYRAKRDREIASLLKKTQEALARDSYASYQMAEKSAQRVLELNPNSYPADAYLAYINVLRYGENGEGEEYLAHAQEYLRAARAANQPHAYIFAASAYIDFFSHKPQEAEADLVDALNIKDSSGARVYASSHLLPGVLGIIQLEAGRLDEARKNLVDAHTKTPADVRVTAALGTVDARLASTSTALAFYQQALKIDPDHVPSLLGLVQLELENDPPDIQNAEKTLGHITSLGTGALAPRQAAFAKFLHSQLLDAEGKTGPAAEEERVALALDPRNPDMLLVEARRLRKSGQPDKIKQAISLVQQAIGIDPNRGGFYAELGEDYLAMPGGASNAVRQLTTAVGRLPPNSRLLDLLASAYQAAGDAVHAQEQWQKALQIEPDNAAAHLGLARLYAARNDATHALSEYEVVAKHAQGATLAEADTELGRAALQKGDAARAKNLFGSALDADKDYAPPYFYAGRMLMEDRHGKIQGRELLAQYLKRAPEGPLAPEAKRLEASR